MGFVWALANEQNDWQTIFLASGNALGVRWQNAAGAGAALRLTEQTGGVAIGDTSDVIGTDTPCWLTVVRDEAVGTYGTLYCYIYSDADRQTLVDTLTVALSVKVDFRFLFAVMSHSSGVSASCSFTVASLGATPLPPIADHLYRMRRAG
jgi:hypothetical protein